MVDMNVLKSIIRKYAPTIWNGKQPTEEQSDALARLIADAWQAGGKDKCNAVLKEMGVW